MFGHFKKSASILTNQNTQMVGNDRWPATICNTVHPTHAQGIFIFAKYGSVPLQVISQYKFLTS